MLAMEQQTAVKDWGSRRWTTEYADLQVDQSHQVRMCWEKTGGSSRAQPGM